MTIKHISTSIVILLSVISLHAQPYDYFKQEEGRAEAGNQLRLHHKIIPLSNSVYHLLEYLESARAISPLPMAKPFTRTVIVDFLEDALQSERLSTREMELVRRYLSDFTNGSNSIRIHSESNENNYAVVGFSSQTEIGQGFGKEGTWKTSLVAEPFISGDLGKNISFSAAAGPGFEHLAPDFFTGSYTKDGSVHFPYSDVGYANLPYQFQYETMWSHVTVPEFKETSPIHKDLTAALIYHTELNGSWFNNTLQINIHNRRRAWGQNRNNLILSETARRFPGIEMKLHPVSWLRYSFITGSLFSYESQSNQYESVYGYDIGQLQNNFTNHLLELILWDRLNLAVGGSNIWSKRLEIAYMVPFVIPHLVQIDVGDHDNLTLYFDVGVSIPQIGKVWGEFFVDEFGWEGNGPLFKRPRNRYGWQVGWQGSILRNALPGTKGKILYTRLTPYVYTHYMETYFNPTGTDRALDMTYTHDGSNLGFYLPPNSSEWQFELVNMSIPNLMLKFDMRYIRHGTNDLSNTEINLNYGDIYRYQFNNVLEYPQMDFTNDGIYDYSMLYELSFDWRLRNLPRKLRYYRLTGSIGYGRSEWKDNAETGVSLPPTKSLVTMSLGVSVDM